MWKSCQAGSFSLPKKYINTVKYFVHFFKQIIVFHSLLHACMVWLKFTRFFLLPLFICRAVVQISCLDSNLDSRKKILDSIWIVLANDLASCNFYKVATLTRSLDSVASESEGWKNMNVRKKYSYTVKIRHTLLQNREYSTYCKVG